MEWTEWQDRTQAAESIKMETTAGVQRQSGVIVQQQTIFSTPKILTRTHR